MNEFLAKLEGWLEQPLVGPALRIGAIILLVSVLLSVVTRIGRAIDRALSARLGDEAVAKRETVTSVVRWVVKLSIIVTGVFSVLGELGLDLAPLLAGAGIAGIAIAFGAQNLLKDFLGGAFVLAEQQYAVGDWVRMAGVEGAVERVTLRMTTLRDLQGNLHVVPNGHGSVVTNETHTWARALLDVEVAYKENVDRVIQVLREVGDELFSDQAWAGKLLEPMEILGVHALGESGVQIRMVIKTAPMDKFRARRELRRRVKNRFDAEGIEIPFPHRTIYTGEDSKPQSHPA